MILSTTPASTWLSAVLLFQTGSVPIWVPLAIILIVVLIFWWGLTRSSIPQEEESGEKHEVDHGDEVEGAELEAVEAEAEIEQDDQPIQKTVEEQVIAEEIKSATAADDLEAIEGIGPKIAGILATAGITTYAQLADTDVAKLEQIVRVDAGIRIANPESWPAQAALAASGDWDGLQDLQDRLTAGRQSD